MVMDRLRREEEYDNVYAFTLTNKYLLRAISMSTYPHSF
eukprot:COSAG04_NODE_54_length_30630_cov_12.996233_3_plen_39_part_00